MNEPDFALYSVQSKSSMKLRANAFDHVEANGIAYCTIQHIVILYRVSIITALLAKCSSTSTQTGTERANEHRG